MTRMLRALAVAVCITAVLVTAQRLQASATCSVSITGISGWQLCGSGCFYKAVTASILVGPGSPYTFVEVWLDWDNGASNYWQNYGQLSTNDNTAYYDPGSHSVSIHASTEFGDTCDSSANFTI